MDLLSQLQQVDMVNFLVHLLSCSAMWLPPWIYEQRWWLTWQFPIKFTHLELMTWNKKSMWRSLLKNTQDPQVNVAIVMPWILGVCLMLEYLSAKFWLWPYCFSFLVECVFMTKDERHFNQVVSIFHVGHSYGNDETMLYPCLCSMSVFHERSCLTATILHFGSLLV